MFTPRSQPVARENSGVNQSTVAVVGSTAQLKANANPYARPTGNKCYRCGEPGHRPSLQAFILSSNKKFQRVSVFFFFDGYARGLLTHSMKFSCNPIKFLMYII